jgi:hypothetical protein
MPTLHIHRLTGEIGVGDGVMPDGSPMRGLTVDTMDGNVYELPMTVEQAMQVGSALATGVGNGIVRAPAIALDELKRRMP